MISLRYYREDANGQELNELRAEHAALVLQGLNEPIEEFYRFGVFRRADTDSGICAYAYPARQGLFVIEIIQTLGCEKTSSQCIRPNPESPSIPKITSFDQIDTKTAGIKGFEYSLRKTSYPSR